MTRHTNLAHICNEYLAGRYRIEVIDLTQTPLLAAGDLSDESRVLLALDVHLFG
jgi:hypothetical protein